MKKVIIVTCELSNPGLNYEKLVNRIKEYGQWAKTGVYSYLILTERTPVDVREHLRVVLNTGDKIYVSTIGNVAAWVGLDETVSKWIRDNQK